MFWLTFFATEELLNFAMLTSSCYQGLHCPQIVFVSRLKFDLFSLSSEFLMSLQFLCLFRLSPVEGTNSPIFLHLPSKWQVLQYNTLSLNCLLMFTVITAFLLCKNKDKSLILATFLLLYYPPKANCMKIRC